MTKILHIGKFYPPANGGMERVVQQLAEGSRRSARVCVLVANTAPRTVCERREGVQVVRVARVGQAWSLPICPALPYWIDRLQSDLVMLHVPNPLAMWWLLRGKSTAPSIVWLHSDIVRQQLLRPWYEATLSRCLARASAVAVSNPVLLDLPSLQHFRSKCHLIPYGIDVSRFTLTPERQSRSTALRQQYGSPLILCVGRLTYYKGISYLLKAMSQIDASLLVVGSGPEGKNLRRLAGRLSIQERVHFLGSVDHETLAACYHACDLFILPSIARAEAFGVVQLEAMASGKPVISTQLPTGVPWVNQDGLTGLVVPPKDPKALAGAIARLLEDPALRQRLGQQGRQRVEREFTIQRMLKQVSDLCCRVLYSTASISEDSLSMSTHSPQERLSPVQV